MIQITSDLVKKIAEERNEILQIIPLVWEYQPYNAKLIPVMGPEEKYLGVWSLEKAPIFKDPWIENQKFYNNFPLPSILIVSRIINFCRKKSFRSNRKHAGLSFLLVLEIVWGWYPQLI